MEASAATVNATCKQLKDETRPAHGNFLSLGLRYVSKLLESSKGQSIRMEVLVSLTSVAYLLVATLGSQRRRSRNWFIQKGVLVAHTLSFLLGAYTLGSMQSNSAGQSNPYLIWAVALFTLHVCTNSSYTLDDIKQATRFRYRWLLYFAHGMLLLDTIGATDNSFLPILVSQLYSIGQYKLVFIQEPYVLASQTWNLNKMVADYMYDEHARGEFVPATMEGCHYLVDWPLNKYKLNAPSYATQLTAYGDEVIDIEKIWLCTDMLLNQDLKDTCLSFSLFHMLRRRFFGFTCGESKGRAHDFVFKGLLLENEQGDTDCNRAFRVIETELAFMYDFFFTKSAGIYYRPRAATVLSLLSAIFLSFIILWAVISRKSMKITDTVISLSILASAALLELLQLLLYWTSIWSRVSFVCQYLKRQARLNTRGSCCSCSSSCCCGMVLRLNELLAKIGIHCAANRHHWQHKLGQYSLLDYKPTFRDKLIGWLGRSDAVRQHQTGILDSANTYPRRVRKKRGKAIEVPAQVKKALVYSLKRTNGELMNGKSSLVSNGVGHLVWACARKVHSASDTTCIILTWHIATWYCEKGTSSRYGPSPNEGTQIKIHHGVATKLSKYCAYLVVHAPKLLPGHHYDSSHVFDAVAVEAKKFLLPPTMRGKYEALRNYGLEESEATIFQSGAKLGKQLEEIEDVTRRWKVLADFWSEMMLYIAPSDNVNEHIEQLTRGGEFITHLWALFSHAGILERDQQSPPSYHPHVQNTCESHQETEQDSESHEGTTHHLATTSPAHHLAATSPTHHLSGNLQMSDFSLQAPSPQVALPAASLPMIPTLPEIAAANEWHIDIPEASRSRLQSPPRAMKS